MIFDEFIRTTQDKDDSSLSSSTPFDFLLTVNDAAEKEALVKIEEYGGTPISAEKIADKQPAQEENTAVETPTISLVHHNGGFTTTPREVETLMVET